MINGIAWSSDNRSILFSSNRAGQYALWKVPLKGGAPQRMPVGTEDATQPACPRDHRATFFPSNRAVQYALWKVPLKGGAPQRMPVGTENATQPAIPQNGNNLAFVEDSAILDRKSTR